MGQAAPGPEGDRDSGAGYAGSAPSAFVPATSSSAASGTGPGDGVAAEQVHWLLDGIDLDAMARHPVRHYECVG